MKKRASLPVMRGAIDIEDGGPMQKEKTSFQVIPN